MQRGDIWLVSLDPAAGHEQQGTRPVLIVFPDAFNKLTRVPCRPAYHHWRELRAQARGFAVSLDGAGIQTTGVIRCDQPRACLISVPEGESGSKPFPIDDCKTEWLPLSGGRLLPSLLGQIVDGLHPHPVFCVAPTNPLQRQRQRRRYSGVAVQHPRQCHPQPMPNRLAVSVTDHPSASTLSRINSPRCGGLYIVAILPPFSGVDQIHVYDLRVPSKRNTTRQLPTRSRHSHLPDRGRQQPAGRTCSHATAHLPVKTPCWAAATKKGRRSVTLRRPTYLLVASAT